MYIIGIEPRAPGLHIFGKLYIPRLGLPQLLTRPSRDGHRCEIFCEEISPIPWNSIRECDLILISSITSTIPRSFSIIKRIRTINTRAPILMGGSHVTFVPEEALDNGADYVFRHEADDSFPRFLEWYTSGGTRAELVDIPGISFKTDDGYYHTPPPPRVDLDTLPTPDLDLIKGLDKQPSIPLITSRGCPWDCEFCSEISMFGRSYRFRSEENILKDLEYYDRRYGKMPVFIADDNFAASKKRLHRLCESIIERRLTRSFTGQVRLDLARHPETLRLMNRAGFQRAYIGYESINPESLKNMRKGLDPDEMESLTRTFHKNRILVHAMWVLGFDGDTLDTVKETIRACIKWRIDTTQFLVLVPIPGSALYEKFKREERIFNSDWSRYDGHHVNFHPKGMTARELQVAVMLDAMPKAYGLMQTARISTRISLRLGLDFFKGRYRSYWREIKTGVETMAARVWGKWATQKIKAPIKTYLDDIPTTR